MSTSRRARRWGAGSSASSSSATKAVRSLSASSMPRACQWAGCRASQASRGACGTCSSSVPGSAACASCVRAARSKTAISPNQAGGSSRVSRAARGCGSGPPTPEMSIAPRTTAYSPHGGSPRRKSACPGCSARMCAMPASAPASSGAGRRTTGPRRAWRDGPRGRSGRRACGGTGAPLRWVVSAGRQTVRRPPRIIRSRHPDREGRHAGDAP